MFNEIPKNWRYGYARVSSKSQENIITYIYWRFLT